MPIGVYVHKPRGVRQLGPWIWDLIDRSGGLDACWPWLGAKQPFGHGRTQIGGKAAYSHRAAWELVHGPIPDGLSVLHHCDNPPCCNPFNTEKHLFLGDLVTNNRDRDAKGRQAVGHFLSPLRDEDVLLIRELYAKKYANLVEIASYFKVSPTAVSSIVRRINWRHL